MSRLSITVLVLALAALAFGLGHQTGLWHEQARQATARSPGSGTPPAPGGVSAAVYDVLKDPHPLERTAELARLLQGLGPEAIGEVRAAYDAFSVDSGDIAMVLLAEWWARLDPESAFEWTREEWVGRHPAVMMAVVYAWARRNPEEAGRAVGEIANKTTRLACMEALIGGWEESGRPGLLEYLADLPSETNRQRAMGLLVRRKVRRDGIDETFRWAEALPDEPARFKLNVFRRVATFVTDVDPQRAAAWAAQHGAGEHGKGLFRRVGVRWAEQDAQATMAWFATLPPGWERDVGVQETYRVWLGRDQAGAMSWMRGAELEPWLEPALALFAQQLSVESPEKALEWAAKVQDEERHRETLVKIGRRWIVVDPEAARAWMDRSELTEEMRAWILKAQQPRRRRPAARPKPAEEGY